MNTPAIEKNSPPAPAADARFDTPRPAWRITLLLAVGLGVALGYILVGVVRGPAPAMAQSTGGFGARGVFAFPAQLAMNNYGLWMVDVDAGNLWCYEVVPGQGGEKLRLVAARSWIHDRYLEDFNITGLTPGEVQRLVEQQSRDRGRSAPADGS